MQDQQRGSSFRRAEAAPSPAPGLHACEGEESATALGESSTLPPVSVSQCEKHVPPPTLHHLQSRGLLCGRKRHVDLVCVMFYWDSLLLVTGVQPIGMDLCLPLCPEARRPARPGCMSNAAAVVRPWGGLRGQSPIPCASWELYEGGDCMWFILTLGQTCSIEETSRPQPHAHIYSAPTVPMSGTGPVSLGPA